MKHNPVHKTFIPEAWDSVEGIDISGTYVCVTYAMNGETKTRYYNRGGE